MDGGGTGTGAMAVYNTFVDLAKRMQPVFISMIMPARWYTGGKGLDTFRTSMLTDRHIRRMIDYPNPKDCFPTANISGGVCLFLWDSRYNDRCEFDNVIDGERIGMIRELDEYDVFVRYNKALSIIKKVISTPDFKSISGVVSTRNPFGLASSVRGIKEDGKGMPIAVYSSAGIGWISESDIPSGKEMISQYKVFMGKVLSGHLGEADQHGQVKVIASILLGGLKEVCTDSYLLIGGYATLEESQNLAQYLKTKFFRYLLLQALASMNISRANFRFVPNLDFTIAWNDEMLYRKYGFNEDEIRTIESTIRPID